MHVLCCVVYALRQYHLTRCFCGIAQMHSLYCALHELSHHQSIKLLLRDHPDVCVVQCFTRTEAMSAWRFAFVGSPRCMFCIVFYMQSGNVRPTNCFCGIAQMNALCFALHVWGQCQANGMLLCDCPDACFALCFTRVEAISELIQWDRPDACFVLLCVSTEAISCYRIVFAESPRYIIRIVVSTHLGKGRLTNCLCGIAQMHVW